MGGAIENSGQKPPNYLPHARHPPPSSQLCGWKYGRGLNIKASAPHAAQPLTYPRVRCKWLCVESSKGALLCTMCYPWWNPTEMSNQTVICFLNCQEIFSKCRPKIPIPNGDGITNTENDARNANSTLNQYFLGSHFNYLLEMKIWLFTYSRLWSSLWTGMLKRNARGKTLHFGYFTSFKVSFSWERFF